MSYFQIFKGLGVFLIILSGVFSYSFFAKDKTQRSKTAGIISGLALLLVFAAMIIVIIANANTPAVKSALNPDDLHASPIYNSVFYALTYFARTTIFALILGAFYYLMLQSRKQPKTPAFTFHKILLAIGVIGVTVLYVIDISKTIQDPEYAKVISFQKYVSIFVGGIFWMMICSIIAAINLPENK